MPEDHKPVTTGIQRNMAQSWQFERTEQKDTRMKCITYLSSMNSRRYECNTVFLYL